MIAGGELAGLTKREAALVIAISELKAELKKLRQQVQDMQRD